MASISGLAGDKGARTGDQPTGIKPIFDVDATVAKINEQVAFTSELGTQGHQAVDAYIDSQRQALREQLRQAATPEEKAQIEQALWEVGMQEHALNILVGAISGNPGAAVTRESLSVAAGAMRQLTIENSSRFPGVVDGDFVLSNLLEGRSAGLSGDGIGVGGVRVNLDGVCGTDNRRCKTNSDGTLQLDADNRVQWNAMDENGNRISLAEWLQTDEGQQLGGPTGGIQGFKGTLFGVPYAAGSWQDRLIESFAGTHDYIGGQATGLYDGDGNIRRGRSDGEKVRDEIWSTLAIVPSAPFAMSELLPAGMWQTISIFLKEAR